MTILCSVLVVITMVVNAAEPVAEEPAETTELIPEIELSPNTLEALEHLKDEHDADDDTDPIVKLFGHLSVISTTENAGRGIEVLSESEVCRPIAEALARFCQSDPELHDYDVPLAALISGVNLPLQETHCNFSPDQAKIEFGGSDFHRFGYLLTRSPGPTPETNRWSMEIYDDVKGVPDLYTFTLDKSEHITREQFTDNALAAHERLVAENPTKWFVENRTVFLLRMERFDLARQAIRDSIKRPDPPVLDRLLAVIVDPPAESEPAAALEAWAHECGEYEHWLDAAYAYHAIGRPDDMERCVKFALKTIPPGSHEDQHWISRPHSLAMALHLQEAGRRETCTRLCEAVLATIEDEGDDYLVYEFRTLSAGNTPRIAHNENRYPFDRIDLEKLRQE